MRVWAFPSFYPYPYPGMHNAGIFAHRQYKGLIGHGAEVNVIIPVLWHPPAPFYYLNENWSAGAKYNFPLERVYDGVKVYYPRISNMKPGRLFRKPHAERYVAAIVGFFEKNKIKLDPMVDVFYSQWVPDAGLVQQAAHKLGVKSAILSIGDDVLVFPHKSKKNYEFIDKTLSEADMLFVVAKYLADATTKLFHKNFRFHVIRRGVNYNLFAPVSDDIKAQLKAKFNFPEDKKIILTVGAPVFTKGWIELLDALQEVKKNDGKFVLVAIYGGQPEIDIKQEAIKRGLADNFIHIGDVPPDKINEYYNAADIFCLPSHTEGIANAVAEAMASGLPVITTPVGGHPELITDHENGIFVAPKNAIELSKQLEVLLSDKDLRVRLGENAREHIVTKWGSFSENSKILFEILKSGISYQITAASKS